MLTIIQILFFIIVIYIYDLSIKNIMSFFNQYFKGINQ